MLQNMVELVSRRAKEHLRNAHRAIRVDARYMSRKVAHQGGSFHDIGPRPWQSFLIGQVARGKKHLPLPIFASSALSQGQPLLLAVSAPPKTRLSVAAPLPNRRRRRRRRTTATRPVSSPSLSSPSTTTNTPLSRPLFHSLVPHHLLPILLLSHTRSLLVTASFPLLAQINSLFSARLFFSLSAFHSIPPGLVNLQRWAVARESVSPSTPDSIFWLVSALFGRAA